jgi:hemerythrin-like metal-binding protein
MQPFHDEQIDADHDLIIIKFDMLCDLARCAGHGEYSRPALVEQLFQHLTAHFEREERIMREEGYEDTEAHMAAHMAMQDDFGRLMKPLPESGSDPQLDIHSIRGLFLGHILTWDEVFAEWLCQKRAAGKARSLHSQAGHRKPALLQREKTHTRI